MQIRHMTARPFVKWVGGKKQLLPEIRRKYPQEISTSLTSKMSIYPIVINQIAISNWDWSPVFDEQIAETINNPRGKPRGMRGKSISYPC